jgi:TolA-binding protein
MSKKLTILLTVLLVAFVGLGISSIRTTDRKLQLRDIKLQDNNIQINKLLLEKQKLNEEYQKEVQDGDTNEQRLQELDKKNRELEQQVKDLQAAKAAKERTIASVGLPGQGVASAATYQPTGDKQAWLIASGIPESEWWAVDYIVSRESGWQPCAYYPSKNDCGATPVNACGLVQQNPCHKIPGDWRDPVVALKWQANYVKVRYGGYAGAVAYWKVHNQY